MIDWVHEWFKLEVQKEKVNCLEEDCEWGSTRVKWV